MSTSISAALVASGGPDWLERRRQAALAKLETLESPTASEEIWRYSPIASRDLVNAERGTEVSITHDLPMAPTITVRADSITIGDLPKGVSAERFSEADGAPEVADSDDFLVALNQATITDGLRLRVERAQLVKEPIVILHEIPSGFSSGRVSM